LTPVSLGLFQQHRSIASPPPFDTSAHSPEADFAGSGPLVRFEKPAFAAGIVALLLGRDVHAMQTKAGIERAVMGFLEEAPKAPRDCGSWKPRIEGGTGPCGDRLGASPGKRFPASARRSWHAATSRRRQDEDCCGARASVKVSALTSRALLAKAIVRKILGLHYR
jgi:hypothetical protein